MGVDPRWRVLYLAAIAVAAFLLRDARIAAGLVLAHALLWVVLGEGVRPLGRQIVKLLPFAAFIIGSYALTKEDAAVDRWVDVDLGVTRVPVNVGGALVGAMMLLRVYLIVFASRIARAGDSRASALAPRYASGRPGRRHADGAAPPCASI